MYSKPSAVVAPVKFSPSRECSRTTFGFLCHHDSGWETPSPTSPAVVVPQTQIISASPISNSIRVCLWRLFHSISLCSVACLSFATPGTFSFAMYLSNCNTAIIRRFHGMKLLDLSSSIYSVSCLYSSKIDRVKNRWGRGKNLFYIKITKQRRQWN